MTKSTESTLVALHGQENKVVLTDTEHETSYMNQYH